MLRPFDIVPKSIFYQGQIKQTTKLFFVVEVIFNSDGSIIIIFFGIKTDTLRDKFLVNIPLHTNLKLDLVISFRNNIGKTAQWRAADSNKVFLKSEIPYVAIELTAVSEILQQAIHLAEHSSDRYSANSFCSTEAIIDITDNIDLQIVQNFKRWKTESVFV